MISVNRLPNLFTSAHTVNLHTVNRKQHHPEMALMTMVARVVDGLPLVGTMQDDEQVCHSIHRTINFELNFEFVFP